jgi:hypothetical protein
MNKITPRKALIWGSAAATSLGLTFSLAARFSPFMTASRLDKLIFLLSLLPLSVIFSVWLFIAVIRPLTRDFSNKKFLGFLSISAAAALVLFAFFYTPPPFPEQHEISLIVLEERNPFSSGSQVEISGISLMEAPSGSTRRIPVNVLTLDGNWRGTNNGYGLIGQADDWLRYEFYQQAGLSLRFAGSPAGGMARIEWDGGTQTIDLYNADLNEKVIQLSPGLDLRRARATHQALVGVVVLLEFWLAFLLIFTLVMGFERLAGRRKVILRNPLLLAAIIIGFLLLQAGAMAINRPVEFKNVPLERVVREALHRPDGAIYHRHLRTMRVLDASSRRLTQLDGIELMPNLVELDLSGNRLIDISGLAGLKHLEKLNLRGNDVREISPLAGLAALEYLNLYDNRNIRNISPLEGLVNLKTLILANVPVSEQAELLSALSHLRKLNLRNAGIDDASFLADLKDLEYLNLYGNTDIRSLAHLAELNQLETLILAHVRVGELVFLENMLRLRYLNLRDSGVTDLDGLAHLTRLEYLNLHSNTDITTIHPLAGLARLETLILTNVPVGTEIGIVSNFSHLRTLNLRNTGLIDLAPIGQLMARGALQDDAKQFIPAGLDIRENPIMETDGDDYAAVRPYWDYVSDRRPLMLPFYAAMESPVFSQPAGFYMEEFTLTLTSDVPSAQIHFTLDGSQPTLNSPGYSEPLDIRERAGEPNGISTITDIAANYRAPTEPTSKATVVRAVAIDPTTGEQSAVATQTYFVGEEFARGYSLPVVSLAGDPADFFDPQNGIYVLGERYAALKDADLTEDQRQSAANFNQRGREWERLVSVEIFEPEGSTFSQKGGLRIHGAGSRRNPQKSLRVYARPEYDEEVVFAYPLFGESEGAVDTKYPVFILRNGGQDWAITLLRDAFVQQLAEGSGLDRQAGRFVIVYLNGVNWGIYHLQERYDAAYLENHYDIAEGQGVILGIGGALISGEPGDKASYSRMLRFIRENNLAVQANYERLDTMMDISSYIDYLIFNIYAANQDWPDKNVVLWRMKTDGYQLDAAAGHDGRWRWMLNDLDISYGLKFGEGDITHDTLSHAQLPGSSGFLTRELLKNEGFRQEFARRFVEYLETTLASERVGVMLEQAAAELRPYMGEFFARWGTGSLASWEEEIALMNKFANERPVYLRKLLNENFEEK